MGVGRGGRAVSSRGEHGEASATTRGWPSQHDCAPSSAPQARERPALSVRFPVPVPVILQQPRAQHARRARHPLRSPSPATLPPRPGPRARGGTATCRCPRSSARRGHPRACSCSSSCKLRCRRRQRGTRRGLCAAEVGMRVPLRHSRPERRRGPVSPLRLPRAAVPPRRSCSCSCSRARARARARAQALPRRVRPRRVAPVRRRRGRPPTACACGGPGVAVRGGRGRAPHERARRLRLLLPVHRGAPRPVVDERGRPGSSPRVDTAGSGGARARAGLPLGGCGGVGGGRRRGGRGGRG